MRHFILALLVSLTACASTPEKKAAPVAAAPEKKEEPKKPKLVDVPARQKNIAHIDPDTLKVTYEKGADLKEVVDQVAQLWSQNIRDIAGKLQQCQMELAAKK